MEAISALMGALDILAAIIIIVLGFGHFFPMIIAICMIICMIIKGAMSFV
jgi:hypothetical protein